VPRPRLWPAAALILLGALFVLKTWLTGDAIRQQRILQTIATSVLVLLALVVWLAFFSRLARRVRVAAVAVVLGLVAVTAALVRVRGVTGDLRPIVELRFGKPAALPALPPAAPPVPAVAGGAGPDRRFRGAGSRRASEARDSDECSGHGHVAAAERRASPDC
jgi:hypothetical protein